MQNIIKGWITSLLGLCIMIATCVYFFGLVDFPHPDNVPKDTQIAIAFAVGLALFLVPSTFIEERLKKYIDKKATE